MAKLSFDPSRELSNDFIRKFNDLAACTKEGLNQAAVFAGCIPDDLAELVCEKYPSADLSQYQKAFRELCYRSDKQVVEGRLGNINTLESNREILNTVSGPNRELPGRH